LIFKTIIAIEVTGKGGSDGQGEDGALNSIILTFDFDGRYLWIVLFFHFSKGSGSAIESQSSLIFKLEEMIKLR
jgi:hypothetical protein